MDAKRLYSKPVTKPVGGYRFISVTQLAMIWYAYESRQIEFRDLRVWFALHEMVSRRCELDSERFPAFGVAEIRGLVGGVGGEHLRRSVARLEALGLVSFGESKIDFAASPDAMPGDIGPVWEMLEKITNNKRRVPVPRRTIRLIAQTGRPVVVATILGLLLRCVYKRDGGVVGEGTCKASWIADVFGVGIRNVRAARKHLIGLNWFTPKVTPQWATNRYGGRGVVNLAWERPESYADKAEDAISLISKPENTETESAPPSEFSTTNSAPPYINQKPLSERNLNQKPAQTAGTPTGFSISKDEEKEPTLRDVMVADLKDTRRLFLLFKEAVSENLIGKSESERLMFVALAEHALVAGTRNPCGLFVSNLRKRRFFITNDDEDAAHQRLKKHTWGSDAKRECEKQKPGTVRASLSDDAKLVAAMERVMRERRVTLDPFVLLKRERPEWTRERWDAAVGEVEAARFSRFSVRDESACECGVAS